MGRVSKAGKAILAAKRGDVDALSKSLGSLFGVKASHTDENGNSLVHWAAVSPNAQVLRLLIRKKLPVNTQSKKGDTPLHWAAQVGRSYPCQLLLSCGARCDVKGQDGDTPLHRAARYGHTDIIDMLCEREDVDINCRNSAGQTPLHLAAEAGFDETVEHLIRLGADIHAEVEETGDTALHLATRRGFGDVASLLVDAGADLKKPNKRGETGFAVYDPMKDYSSEPERTACLIRARAETAKQLQEELDARDQTGGDDTRMSNNSSAAILKDDMSPAPLQLVTSRQASNVSANALLSRQTSLKERRSSVV